MIHVCGSSNWEEVMEKDKQVERGGSGGDVEEGLKEDPDKREKEG